MWSNICTNTGTACDTRAKRTYRAYIALLFSYNMRTIAETAFFLPLFVHSARFYLKAWILYQRGKDTRLRVGFLRAARRLAFIYVFCAFFVFSFLVRLFPFLSLLFSSLCLAFLFFRSSSLYCCFPFLSFSFLSFLLLLAFPTFPTFPTFHTFLLISEIINNIYINTYFVCVCAYIRARARQRRGKSKAQK